MSKEQYPIMYTYLDRDKAPYNDLPLKPKYPYVVGMLVPEEDVINGNIQNSLQLIDKLETSKSPMLNILALMFDGYSLDYRDLIEFPEVNAWIYKLFSVKPYLFYYLSNFAETMKLVYFSLRKNGELGENILPIIIDYAIQHSLEKNETKTNIRKIIRKIEQSIH